VARSTSAGSLLSLDQITAVVDAAVSCGVGGIRLTGGEPLLRKDLPEMVARIARLAPGLDVALTTNGSLLGELALPLAQAGLNRVNVSLDSLRRDRFQAATGRPSLEAVLAGLEAAERAGLGPIKVNTVVVRGLNDDEITEMVEFASEHGYHARFIEFMPLDGRRQWLRGAMVPVDEIRARIESRFALTPLVSGGSPGDDYLLGAGPTRVSLIGAVSRPFCNRCNRFRVTADGFLRSCLFSSEEQDLRPALAAPRLREALTASFLAAAAHKPRGHRVGRPDFVRPRRTMFAIGG
jgi:cyclic pyranopterin phosphate synthase